MLKEITKKDKVILFPKNIILNQKHNTFLSGTHGHWAVRVLLRATPTVTSVNNGHLHGPMTLTPIAERLSEELSLRVFYGLVLPRLGFEHQTFRLLGATVDFDEKWPCEAHHVILKISQLITIHY